MGVYNDGWEKAWSIENIEEHGAEGSGLRYLETRVAGGNAMHLYVDADGNYWYRSEMTERIDKEMEYARQRRKEAMQREKERTELEKKRLA